MSLTIIEPTVEEWLKFYSRTGWNTPLQASEKQTTLKSKTPANERCQNNATKASEQGPAKDGGQKE